MEKTITILTLLLALSVNAMAQHGGGLFQRGAVSDETNYSSYDWKTGAVAPDLPNHGQTDDQNAPLSSGIAVFATLGAAYAFSKSKRRK